MSHESEVETAAPIIVSPTNNSTVRNAEIDVSGTTVSGGTIIARLYTFSGSTAISQGQGTPGTQWAARLPGTFTPDSYRIEVSQGETRTIYVTLRVTPVVITSPSSGEVPNKQFTVTGTGGEHGVGAITLHNAFGNGFLSNATTNPDGTWVATVTLPSETQPLTFYAKQKIGSYDSVNSNQVTVKRSFTAPVILRPEGSSEQNQEFILEGNNGRVGATIVIYEDQGSQIYGSGSNIDTNGNWRVEVEDCPAGRISLVAKQVLGSVDSGPGIPRSFKIKPLSVESLAVSAHDNARVTISGSGHVTAELDLHLVGVLTPEKTFEVDSNPWSKNFPWPPGDYSIDARQSVSDNTGGRIYSNWTARAVNFEVKVPVPTLAVRVNEEGVPVFSGEGNTWPEKEVPTTIRIYIDNAPHPDVPDGTVKPDDDDWSITAIKAFAPGEYSVTAQQLYNGLESAQTEAQTLVIEQPRPAPPEIDPVSDEGRFPTITGNGVSDAKLMLVYSDDVAEHEITIVNDRWSFQRADEALAPGKRSVTAWQVVNDQPSDPVSREFVVATPQPRITLPKQDDQVGADPDVEGTEAVAGATMEIYDYISERLLNAAPMSEEKGWRVRLKDLPFGRCHIFAVQTYEGQRSRPSEPYRSFDVILLPPKTHEPKQETHVPQRSVFSGRGTAWALIELRLKGASPEERVEYAHVDANGEWQIYLELALGGCTVRAMQSIEDQRSVFGESVLFTVVPNEPLIETPADQESVESQCVVSGFADPSGTVTLAPAESPNTPLGTVPVKDDGSWSLTVGLEDSPAGALSLIARQSLEEFDSDWSSPRQIVLRKHPPQLDRPVQGDWVNNRARFAGKAQPEAVIEVNPWFNPDIHLAPKGTTAGAHGDWSTEAAEDLPLGANWATVRQRYVNESGQEQVSEHAGSGRFEIVPDDAVDVSDPSSKLVQ